MELTFAEDFSSDVALDSQLTGTPTSGFYWNRGVHPIVTTQNLKVFLPKVNLTFTAWDAGTTYSAFLDSRKKSDIVTHNDVIYQSLTADNLNNVPSAESSHWLATNLDSLRIKAFIFSVEDNAKAALSLNRMLIENQFIYNIGESLKSINSDFFGWAFEPKGSDYVKIRINQIALQAEGSTALDLYVINQGRLIDTLTLTPKNGVLEFDELNYTIYGKGVFYFILAGGTVDVYSEGAYNDPLRYKGFVCYPVTGTGSTAAEAEYSISSASNGLNFNVSCYLDSSLYLDYNKVDLSSFYRTQFEYDFIKMVANNAHNRFNIDERIQAAEKELIVAESLDLRGLTVAAKYKRHLSETGGVINHTFDKFLKSKKRLKVIKKTI